MLRIKNARVFRDDGTFAVGEIEAEGALFRRVSLDDRPRSNIRPVADGAADYADQEIDAEGCFAVPGLIDLHFHGCAGYDFSDAGPEGILAMLNYQAANGITAVCPATMTLPEERLARACARMAAFALGGSGDAADSLSAAPPSAPPPSAETSPSAAALVGIQLEGPFLSPHKAGAQDPEHVKKPDIAMFRRLQDAARGLVRILAVAPELVGASELISALSREVVCSLAHTTADYDTARAAFACGASHVTHLYNAMPPFAHREPGLIGAVFDSPGVTAELICDGVHIHPAVVRATFRQIGAERVVMVSDSMMATGLGDGAYELGGLPVRVEGNVARLLRGGSIAGSVTNLMGCVRAAVNHMGVPLGDAIRAASLNPARLLGLSNERGGIASGKYADLALLDDALEVRRVILRGRPLPPP